MPTGFFNAGSNTTGLLGTDNVDFSGSANPQPTMIADGQLLIGATAFPRIRVDTLTAGSGITITNGPGSITISAVQGVFSYTQVNHATGSPYVVLSTDDYISCDSTAGTITLNFPNAPTTDKIWIVKDRTGQASGNNISITSVGGAILFDGLTTYKLTSNFSSIQLLFNGTSYEIF